MGRPRKPNRKGWPPNLRVNAAGYYSFYNPLTKKTKGIGRDKASAMAEARAANALLANMAPSALTKWVSGVTVLAFREYVPLFRAQWEARRLAENKPLAKATLRTADDYLAQCCAAPFAHKLMPDITTVDIATFLTEVAASRGAPTAGQVRTRLKTVFRAAEEAGQIEAGRSPVSATRRASQKVKRQRLTLEQFLALRALAAPWMVNAMNLGLLTGHRRGDIAQLKFSDWRDNGLYVIQGKSQGDSRIRLDAEVHISAAGVSVGDVVRACRDNIVSAYLVHQTARSKGAKLAPNTISAAFADLVKAAKIPVEANRTPPTFHEIRSLAARLYTAEFGLFYAQAVLGHKDAKTTAGYNELRGSGFVVVRSGKRITNE